VFGIEAGIDRAGLGFHRVVDAPRHDARIGERRTVTMAADMAQGAGAVAAAGVEAVAESVRHPGTVAAEVADAQSAQPQQGRHQTLEESGPAQRRVVGQLGERAAAEAHDRQEPAQGIGAVDLAPGRPDLVPPGPVRLVLRVAQMRAEQVVRQGPEGADQVAPGPA
jgi:hypothetical protein